MTDRGRYKTYLNKRKEERRRRREIMYNIKRIIMLSYEAKRIWVIFKKSEETYDAEVRRPPRFVVFVTFI